MKIKAIVERGTDGTYGAYIRSGGVPYGIIGDGNSVKDAIADFMNSYNEMRDYYAKINKKFTECEFQFQYDVASFIAYYGTILSLAGLERLTGVNQGQLSHYATGRRKPSRRTTLKIESKLRELGNELNQIQFI